MALLYLAFTETTYAHVFQLAFHFGCWCWSAVASIARAQQLPEEGGREIQLWTGGGHTVPGGTKNTSVWNLGLRYGWILTRPHGPGFLKGRFEYAVDAVPVFFVFQPANTSYGAGFNPIDLKWNFATRSAVVPYLEIDGGTLFTNHTVPTGNERGEFYDQWGVWVSFPR